MLRFLGLFASLGVQAFETACPELWHFDELEESCLPNRENVNLICTADLITIELALLGPYTDITVNSCENGVTVSELDSHTNIAIDPVLCDAEVTFEDGQIVLRNTVEIAYGKSDIKIPFDCVFSSSNLQSVDSSGRSTRRRRAAMAESTAQFEIGLDYYDNIYDATLPASRRLVVGEDAFVMVGLKQKITGIEMAVTNCTVYDDEYAQSYSVIDYPRCPDTVVNAHLDYGSSQWENRLSYRVFEFVNDDMSTTLLKLVCRVILCDANSDTSDCKKTCSGDSDTSRLATMHEQTVEN